MTPTFMGSEPTTGTYKGEKITLFRPETTAGLAMIRSLTTAQRAKAVSSQSNGNEDMKAGAGQDNLRLAHEGLKGSELTSAQQEKLLDLVGVYVGYIDERHAEVKMAEVKKHLDETYFFWMGSTEDDSAFYYRVHSPVVLIEYDAQAPLFYKGDASATSSTSSDAGGPGGGTPSQEHIHTIIRTPNGGDYGIDLLKLHLEHDH